MSDRDTANFYEEQRLFWVVDGRVGNEELFTCLQDAEEFRDTIKDEDEPRIRICVVRHAYYDKQLEGWNYDDQADTFTTILSDRSEHWSWLVKGEK